MPKKKRQKIGPKMWDFLQWRMNFKEGLFELKGQPKKPLVSIYCESNGPAFEIVDWLRDVADELEAVANEI